MQSHSRLFLCADIRFYILVCRFCFPLFIVLFACIWSAEFSFHACIPNDLFSSNIEPPKLASPLHALLQSPLPWLSFCPWNMKTIPVEYEQLFLNNIHWNFWKFNFTDTFSNEHNAILLMIIMMMVSILPETWSRMLSDGCLLFQHCHPLD